MGLSSSYTSRGGYYESTEFFSFSVAFGICYYFGGFVHLSKEYFIHGAMVPSAQSVLLTKKVPPHARGGMHGGY